MRQLSVFDGQSDGQSKAFLSAQLGIAEDQIRFNPVRKSEATAQRANNAELDGIHCAIGGKIKMESMVEHLVRGDQSDQRAGWGNIFYIVRAKETGPSGLRLAVLGLESMVQLTMFQRGSESSLGAGIAPQGLLGWGALDFTENLPPDTDAIRMLAHLSRSLRRLGVNGSTMDLVRAAIASLVHGSSVQSLRTASDGETCFVEVKLEQTGSPFTAATGLARWLDGALKLQHANAIVWIKKTGRNAYRAGIATGSPNMPSALILDLAERQSEPAIEADSQTGYNVA